MFTVSRPATPVERALDEAIANLRRGNPEAARTAARRAAELDPARLDALWLWDCSASELWAFAEAERVFAEGARRTLPATPRQVSFLAQHARALASLGRNAKAIAVADRALAAGASDGGNLNILGAVFQQAGQIPRALEVRKRAVNDEPGLGAWRRYGEKLDPLKRRLIVIGAIDADAKALSSTKREPHETLSFPACCRAAGCHVLPRRHLVHRRPHRRRPGDRTPGRCRLAGGPDQTVVPRAR
ncbi:hypothetical protein ABAC402_01785 [Asticcacaulis sp. AC402]|nr:hypothetical protein ABAC402_01785 [Asticcacaulis sp. AC402]